MSTSPRPDDPSAASPAIAGDATAGPVVPIPLDAEHVLGVSDPSGTLHLQGDARRPWPLASVSKPVTALGVLIAVARGLLELDEPAGPTGSTVRHLLAHTAGYPFEGTETVAAPGTRRIYSNTGFEVLAAHVEEATCHPVDEWLEQTVVSGLGLVDLEVGGSPAAGFRGTVPDLLAVGRELLTPTLIPAELAAEARSLQFPGLDGILPGYGRQRPNDWGLGLELRGEKDPHWTGQRNSPSTVGHFGQSGSFLWIDPEHDLIAAFLGAAPFGADHVRIWPAVNDAILERFGPRR